MKSPDKSTASKFIADMLELASGSTRPPIPGELLLHLAMHKFTEDTQTAPFPLASVLHKAAIGGCRPDIYEEARKVLDRYSFFPNETLAPPPPGTLTPAVLADLHEALLAASEQLTSPGAGRRSLNGVFYTPPDEVDLVCSMALHRLHSASKCDWTSSQRSECTSVTNPHPRQGAPNTSISIWDPSCGCGNFLVRMALLDTFTATTNPRTRNHQHLDSVSLAQPGAPITLLYGTDLSADALAVASFRLSLLHPSCHWNLTQNDALLSPPQREFDLVVGNPPYVRHERIEGRDGYSRTEYKKLARSSITDAWRNAFGSSLASSAEKVLSPSVDLYVYFMLAGLAKLAPQGVLAFVTSDSWLDSRFGGALGDLLLDSGTAPMVVRNIERRTIPNAGTGTIIVVLSRPGSYPPSRMVRFVALRRPPHGDPGANQSPICSSQEAELGPISVEMRARAKEYAMVEVPRGRAKGWGNMHFRACELGNRLLQILALTGDHVTRNSKSTLVSKPVAADPLRSFRTGGRRSTDAGGGKARRSCLERHGFQPLSSIAQLEYGNKPGIAEFFVLPRNCPDAAQIQPEFLRPALTSTRQVERYTVFPDSLPWFFHCSQRLSELEAAGAHATVSWIRKGARRTTVRRGRHTIEGIPWPKVASVRSNMPEWHCLALKRPGQFVIPCLLHRRFFVAYNPHRVADSNMFFHGVFREGINELFGLALLNCTITYLMMELHGRCKGLGGLNLYGVELAALPVPSPALFSPLDRIKLAGLFESMARRRILDIADECGAGDPARAPADRREIDSLILIRLGLDLDYLAALYFELPCLVTRRVERK